jgi:tRNA-specific 2-thiouridylase
MARIVVGISGGVDSSVAAYLLKEQGHEVIGMFMINWHDTCGLLEGDCPAHDDEIFAKLVCKKLDIPLHIVDLSEEYSKRVVDYMFDEYSKGRTPNPDVLCNREMKFDVFLKEALKLGAEYVATGHYCQKSEYLFDDGKTLYSLKAGYDTNKDQSYFLCQLTQEQLKYALFPIGHLTKPEVRKIAEEQGLATAKRKDSQGICFVGKVDLPEFLKQKLKEKEGDIIEIPNDWEGYNRPIPYDDIFMEAEPFKYSREDGKVIGKHNGAHFYTIGQSKGLGIGGRKEKMFVIATDVENNIIYVGEGHKHKGLNRRMLYIKTKNVHFINPDHKLILKYTPKCKYNVRIRYRQALQKAEIVITEKKTYIIFDEPQRGISPGQFAAWYDDSGNLLGSGVIE